jgi:hypothetical protein
VALDKPIAEYAAVQTWRHGLTEQWDEEPEMEARLEILSAFCDSAGAEPDAMIAECTREVESGKRIRIKARREYSEKIAAFQTTAAGTPRDQMKAGNVVRSFFIHNGIFMQAGLNG